MIPNFKATSLTDGQIERRCSFTTSGTDHLVHPITIHPHFLSFRPNVFLAQENSLEPCLTDVGRLKTSDLTSEEEGSTWNCDRCYLETALAAADTSVVTVSGLTGAVATSPITLLDAGDD